MMLMEIYVMGIYTTIRFGGLYQNFGYPQNWEFLKKEKLWDEVLGYPIFRHTHFSPKSKYALLGTETESCLILCVPGNCWPWESGWSSGKEASRGQSTALQLCEEFGALVLFPLLVSSIPNVRYITNVIFPIRTPLPSFPSSRKWT